VSPQYAANTEVSSYKSREEIERTLIRYGAKNFAYGTTETHSLVGFTMRDRQIRFILPMPNRNSTEFTMTPSKGWRRSDAEAEKAYEQAIKAKWRSLSLVIKAKLEAVERGIVTFEEEFAMHMVMPGGMTVGEMVTPAIEQAYAEGGPAPLLDALSRKALPR
jgi:hypothetical protein